MPSLHCMLQAAPQVRLQAKPLAQTQFTESAQTQPMPGQDVVGGPLVQPTRAMRLRLDAKTVARSEWVKFIQRAYGMCCSEGRNGLASTKKSPRDAWPSLCCGPSPRRR